MFTLLIFLIILLLVGIVVVRRISYRRKATPGYLTTTVFASASTRKLTADEREAVSGYLSALPHHEENPLFSETAPDSISTTVYIINRVITRYGLAGDDPNRWRYYLDSTEVHLPPNWEQYITDDNQVELIATRPLPLVIALNGHTLQEYIGELHSLLPENPLVSADAVHEQKDEQVELLAVRRETRAEQALNRPNGWPEALMISLAFFMFFLCLKVPDMLIPWLVSGATLLLLAGLYLIFIPVRRKSRREIRCLRGTPRRWGLFGESDQEQINAISLGTIDLIYPDHWQPFIRHTLGQKTEVEIDASRHVVRQGSFLSLHDEVKNFPLQYWLRNSILSVAAFLVLIALIIWVPLEMPFMLTTSWLKGAQTIEAHSVGQLENTTLHVGDTLKIKGTGMCNIHPGAWTVHQNSPYTPFDCSQIIWNSAHPVPLPESDIVEKATALIQEVSGQLHPQHENLTSINPQLASAIEQSGMVLLSDFSAIVRKTQALCTDDDECIRLKNALVNLSNSRDWNTLTRLASSGKLSGINVLLRPVSAESLDNLVSASTAPFFIRETSRAAQALNSPLPGGFLIINEEGDDLVDRPMPGMSLYDYPAQEQWSEFQRLAKMLLQTPFSAEGIITSIRTGGNNTQYITLHSIPDSTSIGRYIGTTILFIAMIVCALYNGLMATRRRQRSRNRLAEIQRYYEQCLNLQLTGKGQVDSLF